MEKRPVASAFLRIMGDSRRQVLTIPLLAIFLSLLVGGVIFTILGSNPLATYQSLLQGAGLLPKTNYAGGKSMLTDFTSFVGAWTPLLFASLSVAVALRAGLFNIGVSGQMLVAGFIASITVGYSELHWTIAKPAVILIALVVGGLTGGLIGLLKHRFNINEVVSTIMVNYIAQYVISFFISTQHLNPVSRQSDPVTAASRLTIVNVPWGDLKIDLPLGMLIGILVALCLEFLLTRTTFGFELKSVGSSPSAAGYAGMNVGKNRILAMILSGGLAGLAGATYYLGYFNSIQPKVLATTGFDAIAVSLLAGSNPAGIIFSSFLISVISKGSTYMSSSTGLESEIAWVLTGTILLFSACGVYLQHLVKKLAEKVSTTQTERGDDGWNG